MVLALSSNPDEVEYYTPLLGELLTKAEFIFDDIEEFVTKNDIVDE